jgi:DNA polymerase III alpha subunit
MYAPISNFTHYSLQYGFCKPKDMLKKCLDNGYKACAITDYKSILGVVDFFKEFKGSDVKPIAGCSFDGFTLYSKNKSGWFDLIDVISNKRFNSLTNKNLICVLEDGQSAIKQIGSSILSDSDIISINYPLQKCFYTNKSEVDVHRISLCSGLKTDLASALTKTAIPEFAKYNQFFKKDSFYIPDKDEAVELEIMNHIVNLCETYGLSESPQLPTFPTPNGETEEEYLRILCRQGWSKLEYRGRLKTAEDIAEYNDRLDREFKIIKEANLFGYFLIVWDILRYINSMGWLSGPGRGSAAGCLISYLIGITKIDPIEHELLFERFYNESRNTKDNVSLPDIDIDVPSDKREQVISYIRNKYGANRVSQMITIGRLQGRSSLKEVLRINQACGFGEMNAMTEHIPDEAAISDQLEAMDEEDRSIIRWALLHNVEELRNFCVMNDDGTLSGDYAQYFDQAIRLEGTYKNLGKHAAGVIISKNDLKSVCPMLTDEDSGEVIAGLEMKALETLGQCKFDVLGVAVLSKLMRIQELIHDEK